VSIPPDVATQLDAMQATAVLAARAASEAITAAQAAATGAQRVLGHLEGLRAVLELGALPTPPDAQY